MIGPVLVTGASGQVGTAVIRLLSAKLPTASILAPRRTEMDLADRESIRSHIRSSKPRWIVSCAAYTAVDAAETQQEAAFAANATAPGILAEEAARAGAGLIHYSTDYVFDGSGDEPWLETDATGPLNVYGTSKLAGEQAIAAVASASPLAWVVLRTSWVYSGGGKNFARTMLRLLSSRSEPLRIVADQHGAPTSAADLASAALRIMTSVEDQAGSEPLANTMQTASGVYHCAGSGETTWAGFAEHIREYLQQEHDLRVPAIVPVASAEYPTPAARPLNSRLNCQKLVEAFGVHMPHWQASLVVALRELAATDLPAR
ncbi:MAG: dTDP-4-dehydrorhamnose reductase [Janthinobacterium lividum]